MDFRDEIDALAQATKFGSLNLELKLHEGKVMSAIVNTSKMEKYSSNSEAVARILHMIKELQDNAHSGSTTFTVVTNAGQITRLVMQGYDQKNYKG